MTNIIYFSTVYKINNLGGKVKNIKAVLFDFDGVIIDSSVDCMREIIDIAKKLHLHVPNYEFIRKLWGGSL